jgi:heme-degrading monooxygenase HmoA
MRTPDLPASYWAVIFTNQRTSQHDGEYDATAARMQELAAQQPGYLGIDSARNPDGSGITVSYWMTEADLVGWKAVAEHRAAQQAGADRFYSSYTTRITQVGRQYEYKADEG